MTTGERFRKWRHGHGLTQEQVEAKEPMLWQSLQSRLETGSALPTLEQAAAIERLTDGQIKAVDWVRRKAG